MYKVPMMEFSVRKDMALIISSTRPFYEMDLQRSIHGGSFVEDSVRADGEFINLAEEGEEGDTPTIADEFDRLAFAYGKDPQSSMLIRDQVFRNLREFEDVVKKSAAANEDKKKK